MSDGMKRRDFLKVLGVSGAGVATVGCGTGEIDRLIPYVIPSEDIVPGVATWYTSTCRECPAGCGIHVETHEGRVTKLEGNPENPISRGNLCARGQAAVQGLYHPDRYQGPATYEAGIGANQLAWSTAERELAERIRDARGRGRGAGIVFLTDAAPETSRGRLIADFARAVGGRALVYEPWGNQPRNLRFADADVLVSFGADFLETWGSPVDYAWQFAQMHGVRNGRRGKFVWVGPHRPLTGLNADQWIAPLPGTEARIAQAMAGTVDLATAARETGISAETIAQLAREFRAGRGVALGPGAAVQGASASDLQAAVDRLNGAASPAAPAQGREIAELVGQMRAGQVEVLLVDASNPVYSLPGALGFGAAMERVPTRVSFSSYPTETAALATLILPDNHFLESWDDYVPIPGVRELVQPAMRPVFNTKQTEDVLLSVARLLGLDVSGGTGANTFYDYLRASWPGGQEAWREALRRGGNYPPADAAGSEPVDAGSVAIGPAPAPLSAQYRPTEIAPPAPGEDFHLVVYPSYRFYDGRTANRPWLLELPDPVSKISWQSWVEIHPDAARRLGVELGDVLAIQSPYGRLDAPAYVWPGVRPDTVAIQTGLGHKAFGRYTEGVGVNPNALLPPTVDARTGSFVAYGAKVRLTPTGEVNFRSHGLFEGGSRVQSDREIAQAISLSGLRDRDAAGPGHIPGTETVIRPLKGKGGFAPTPTHTDPAAYPPPGTQYGQYIEGMTRWAMAMDLARCIGCSACVTACYAENNIPVVGPSEVKKGREMTWMRIERYFAPGKDELAAYQEDATNDVRFIPMPCQQCGNAPCEPVCPVYAAYHTPDGLNAQVYNRCVGTRYCANNCPYKVRYFNWFTYRFDEPLNWQLNPDVTVREKGVMEKCTFCVQRIREAERTAAQAGRPVRDGEVTPACAQTCPAEVIVFGNIADPNSEVAKVARSNRSYRVLEELNTQPAIVYLKKVTLHEPEHGAYAEAEEAEPAGAGSH